jgi:hypothetical protein
VTITSKSATARDNDDDAAAVDAQEADRRARGAQLARNIVVLAGLAKDVQYATWAVVAEARRVADRPSLERAVAAMDAARLAYSEAGGNDRYSGPMLGVPERDEEADARVRRPGVVTHGE